MLGAFVVSRINKLTPDQIALLPEWRDKWLSHGLSTEPLNWEAACNAVDLAYECAGLRKPPLKIRLQSPLAGCYGAALINQVLNQVRRQIGGQVLDQVWDQVWNQVGGQVRDQVRRQVGGQVWNQVGGQVGDQVLDQVRRQVGGQVWNQVGGQVGNQVRDQIGGQVRRQVGDQVGDQVLDPVGDQVSKAAFGNHDSGWIGFYSFFNTIGVQTKISGLAEVAQTCGWWWPFEGAVIITERPTHLFRDDFFRLHHESKPAIRYSDGFSIYAWHGVRVPSDIILRPQDITAQRIKDEHNQEVARVMLERYGYDRWIQDMGGELVAQDDMGKLWKTKWNDEDIVLAEVLNSTPEPDGSVKTYFLSCHPELRIMHGDGQLGEPQPWTPRSAIATTFGLTADQYKPLEET